MSVKKSGIQYTPEYVVKETGERFTGKTQDATHFPKARQSGTQHPEDWR